MQIEHAACNWNIRHRSFSKLCDNVASYLHLTRAEIKQTHFPPTTSCKHEAFSIVHCRSANVPDGAGTGCSASASERPAVKFLSAAAEGLFSSVMAFWTSGLESDPAVDARLDPAAPLPNDASLDPASPGPPLILISCCSLRLVCRIG